MKKKQKKPPTKINNRSLKTKTKIITHNTNNNNNPSPQSENTHTYKQTNTQTHTNKQTTLPFLSPYTPSTQVRAGHPQTGKTKPNQRESVKVLHIYFPFLYSLHPPSPYVKPTSTYLHLPPPASSLP